MAVLYESRYKQKREKEVNDSYKREDKSEIVQNIVSEYKVIQPSYQKQKGGYPPLYPYSTPMFHAITTFHGCVPHLECYASLYYDYQSSMTSLHATRSYLYYYKSDAVFPTGITCYYSLSIILPSGSRRTGYASHISPLCDPFMADIYPLCGHMMPHICPDMCINSPISCPIYRPVSSLFDEDYS